MSNFKDLKGKRFGRLIALKRLPSKRGCTMWLCECDCGTIKAVNYSNLMQGRILSCGCLNQENRTKHNQSRTRLYNIYCGIKERCNNPHCANFKYYGAKNIKMNAEWQNDFSKFYEWSISNGYDNKLSIERINNNGNYEPNNCRWATAKEQANNTSRNKIIEFNGISHTLSEWSDITGIKKQTIFKRLKLGWNIEKTLSTPTRKAV